MANIELVDAAIKQTFDGYQPQTQKVLLQIRAWIFEIASNSEKIGGVEECLKWGEPSYVTTKPKSGTTLRIAQLKSDTTKFGMYVSCQSSLIEEFRVAYPDLNYDKNRGVIFDVSGPLQIDVIKQFIYLALSYHSRKR